MTIAGTGTLTINAACALTPGVTFTGSVSLAGTTVTLGADWTITGSLTSASGTNVMNGNACYIGKSLTTTVALRGTTTLVMNGTGTISGDAGAQASNNITVDTAGTISFGSTFAYGTGTFTWLAGTFAAPGTPFFYLKASCSFDLKGTVLPVWLVPVAGVTVTRMSDFNVSVFALAFCNAVFSGNFNTTVGVLEISTIKSYGSSTFSLSVASGTTLTVTSSVGLHSLNGGGYAQLKAITASSPFYFVYTGTISNFWSFGSVYTDVDASGSSFPLPNYNGGTLTRCTNIRNVNLPVIPSSVSIGG
jgi:hypothetical protein